MDIPPKVNIDLLCEELATLARISEAEPPVVTRVVFTEADLRARAFVRELCVDAGLSLKVDAIGNTVRALGGQQGEPCADRDGIAYRCHSERRIV